jgi:hypothetical protein
MICSTLFFSSMSKLVSHLLRSTYVYAAPLARVKSVPDLRGDFQDVSCSLIFPLEQTNN